jgi:hypothetical protein
VVIPPIGDAVVDGCELGAAEVDDDEDADEQAARPTTAAPDSSRTGTRASREVTSGSNR